MRNLFRRRLPTLTGFGQVVRLHGKPMRVNKIEHHATERVLCLVCGTVENHETVTISLIPEEHGRAR
jgi:hypothetical protein